MNELKEKIDKIYYLIKKIDINITNTASTSVDKIIDIIDTAAITASSLVIDTAAITASSLVIDTDAITASSLVIDTAAITASRLVIDTAAITASSLETVFDINMYIKCLIHEIRTPLNNITIGINFIENNIIENKNNDEILNTINGLYKSLDCFEDIITKFCVIKNGILVLNNYEPFSIKTLMIDIENILIYNIKEKIYN